MLIYSIPFISAAIGWFTNFVAIKMLFRPREEKNYGLFKLHGIFPKRKEVLAERLGKVVARDLFNVDMIVGKLDNEANREQIKTHIEKELEEYLRVRLKASNPMLGMLLNDKMIVQIMEKLSEMLDESVPKLMGQLTTKVKEIDIEEMVYQKVSNFSNEKLEALLMSVIKKELAFIEWAGAVLGFIIGLVQIGIIYLSEGSL
ncbi:DUF445 family protein [Flammeovirgaceae bacterium SG7u.111]|nr:DUF445 family protein [Flammeovirgaceae bacterium SG7u.132]WPO34098.1 DUF445 family protein [Flammeovirgaceae bacterium SG7u.111]